MLSVRDIVSRIAAGQSTAEAELARSARLIAQGEPALKAFASRPESLSAGAGPLAGPVLICAAPSRGRFFCARPGRG